MYRAGRLPSAGNPHEAASRYRRASIYASDPDLKELALFLAAETNSVWGITTRQDGTASSS